MNVIGEDMNDFQKLSVSIFDDLTAKSVMECDSKHDEVNTSIYDQ